MLIIEKAQDSSGAYCKMEQMMNSNTPAAVAPFKMSDEQAWRNRIVDVQEKKRLERTYEEEMHFKAYVRQKKMEEEARARANRWQ